MNWGEFLDTVVVAVADIDVAGCVHGYAQGHVELAGRFSELPPLGKEFAFGREHLDAVVVAVRDEDVTFLIHGDSRREVKLSFSTALFAPFGQEVAVGVELLDTRVLAVTDINMARPIGRNAFWRIELAVPRA